MAKQKFNAIEREAIWDAYERKCAYTGEILEINNFHIDHIIPEIFTESSCDLNTIKFEYGLSDSFDIFGYENILPCNPYVNLKKSSIMLEPSAVHYFLSLAAKNKNKIIKNIGKIKERIDKGKALILLQQLLESQKISQYEAIRLIEEHGNQPKDIFKILVSLKFADDTEVDSIERAEIEDLKDRPIKFGKNHYFSGLTFRHNNGEQTLVRTCREYSTAVKAGYYPNSNFDLKLSAYLEHQSGLLSALERAQIPRISYIAKPHTGVADLGLLPFSLFENYGDEILEIDSDVTYQELVDKGIFFIRRIGTNVLVIESSGMGQHLVEVVRADFNGDGIEDILIFQYHYATRGSFGFGDLLILTRKTPNSKFEKIELI